MKGLLYPVLAVLVALMVTGAVASVTMAVQRWREAHAVRNARWESYSSVQGGGSAEVGVRLVARWGTRVKVLKSEEMILVRVDDLSSTAFAEAQNEADLRASSYNATGVRR